MSVKGIVDDLIINKDLNEANTRYHIIDRILKEILDWPSNSFDLEVHKNGNYADYVMIAQNRKPVLLIESKKEGVYFETPDYVSKNFSRVKISKLLSDKNIKSAVFQVKEYCEDMLCNYGCISNGNTWIIFRVVGLYDRPWKDLPAYVIKNINFFEDDYTEAYNLLSYNAVVNNGSLKDNIGISQLKSSEVFYPKNSIIAYNTPVNSNDYAHVFSNISRRYLGNIPIDNKEFVKKCYVTNKGHYDQLQQSITGFIFDSLTPYYKAQGFSDFTESKSGGAFVRRIEKILQHDNLNTVMILFGGRGSGKSTFIKRLLFHVRPFDIIRLSHIGLVDLIDAPQTTETLSAEIWNRLITEIDTDNLLQKKRSDLIKLFEDKFTIFENQFLSDLPGNSVEKVKTESDFLKEKLSDRKYVAERLSKHLKEKNKGIILFLDNMDQLTPDLQDICFLNAFEIAQKLNGLVIISMREERFYDAKMRGALDAYHTPGFHLTSPVITDVLIKRIRYIREQLNQSKDLKLDFNIEQDWYFHRVQNFLLICEKEIKRKNSALGNFLRYSTQGDVRQALEYFKGFLTSGYTNINEFTSTTTWRFQIHQVIKPMMIPDRMFYDERLSKIPNLYQLRNDLKSSHFTGLRILSRLSHVGKDKLNQGFIDVKYIIQDFDDRYDLAKDAEKNIDLFLQRGVVESNNRLEEFSEDVDQIRISSFGLHLYNSLSFDFVYLDLTSLDCGIYDLELHNHFVRSANNEVEYAHSRNWFPRIESRLERVEKFLEYLHEKEKEEVNLMNIDTNSEMVYMPKIKEEFAKQKNIILRSARRKK